jgi:hypothetical protein
MRCPGMPAGGASMRCYTPAMLTRSQVARRLGRSVATVRRLEGSILHPHIDGDGVHRFDESEVRQVARSRERVAASHAREPMGDSEEQSRSEWFSSVLRSQDHRTTPADSTVDNEDEMSSGIERRTVDARDHGVADTVDELRARVQALEAHAEQRRAQQQKEHVEIRLAHANFLREALEFLDGLSARQLRRLDPELLALLDEAASQL